MLWLNYVRQSGEAYADLKRYLEALKQESLNAVVYAKEMEQVHKIQGTVECLVNLQLTVTQEERANRERAHQADRAAREARGETRAPR